MSETVLRVFVYTAVPPLLTWSVIRFDRSANTRVRRLETLLIFLFSISVAANGISGFIAHFFMADVVAASIGWQAGSPFQLEVAFANLALGLLGIVATGRRDGFREATVLAVATFAFGATIVHLMDIVATGNLAPGNSIQNVSNLLRPALLIWALVAARRTPSVASGESDETFQAWRMPLVRVTAPLAIIVSTAYGIGFAVGQAWLITCVGLVIGAGVVAGVLARSETHQVTLRSGDGLRP